MYICPYCHSSTNSRNEPFNTEQAFFDHRRACGRKTFKAEKKAQKKAPKPEVKRCPNCRTPMVLRKGMFGTFWGCFNYPRCNHTEKFIKPVVKTSPDSDFEPMLITLADGRVIEV